MAPFFLRNLGLLVVSVCKGHLPATGLSYEILVSNIPVFLLANMHWKLHEGEEKRPIYHAVYIYSSTLHTEALHASPLSAYYRPAYKPMGDVT
jgi:hypothetical protein